MLCFLAPKGNKPESTPYRTLFHLVWEKCEIKNMLPAFRRLSATFVICIMSVCACLRVCVCVWERVCVSRKVNDINGGWLAPLGRCLQACLLFACISFPFAACLLTVSDCGQHQYKHKNTPKHTDTPTHMQRRGLLGSRLSVCR